MPRLSRWFIRASFVYLLLGFTAGGLMLAQKGVALYPLIWQLLPAHIEFLFFGWTVQLIMGVGFWIFPRFWRSRGNETPAWAAFWLLNVGIWLVSSAPLLASIPIISVMGRVAEVGAALAFALHAWPRIKPPGAALK